MVDETSKESAPIRDSVPDAQPTRSPDLDATKLMAEVQPRGDNQVSGLSKLEDLSNFPKTALLGGPMDKGIASEAKQLATALPFTNAMRFMTKSA